MMEKSIFELQMIEIGKIIQYSLQNQSFLILRLEDLRIAET